MQVHPGRALGRLEEQYIELALHYFVVARHAAFCLYGNAAAYTFHVAFEMLFEAELIRTGAERATLTNYHHDLDRIWKAFKLATAWKPGSKWDRLVTHLDEWRNIRFPTQEPTSAALGVTGWVTTSTQAIDRETGEPIGRPLQHHPRYQLKLWEMDELFTMVITRLLLDAAWVRQKMAGGVETYLKDNNHPLF